MACPFGELRGISNTWSEGAAATSGGLPVLPVEAQPLGAAVLRVAAALDYLGQPLSDADTAAIEAAVTNEDEAAAIATIQNTLDAHCLAVDLPPPALLFISFTSSGNPS